MTRQRTALLMRSTKYGRLDFAIPSVKLDLIIKLETMN